MMRRVQFALALAMLPGVGIVSGQEHAATGIVLEVHQAQHAVVVSCDAIEGYMPAMDMSFTVRDVKELGSLRTGVPIRFRFVERGHALYADQVQAVFAEPFDPESMQAAGLASLQGGMNPSVAAQVVEEGKHVPDFELTDQVGRQIRLSNFAGKVVLLTFGYSRCPNPAYCYRLSNNLAQVRSRFAARMARELVLVTVAIDPEHDQGTALAQYAAVWKADPASWHFLTGPLPEVKRVAGMFGMNFWRDEGLLTHSLRTVVIDRSGVLAANLQGNGFTARQLGDLVETVMNRPR